MAMTSGVYGALLRDALSNAYAYNIHTGGDTVKWQIVSDTESPNYSATTPVEADIANEVTGTGYTTGGETLASQAVTIATGVLKWDGADISLPTTTLSSLQGMIFLDDTLATPVKPLIAGIDFTTPYSTVAGTLAITFDAAGIFTIAYV